MIEATTTTAEIAEHQRAGLEDVGRVALGDAVVDDVAVERGEVQRRQRLDDEEADDQRERRACTARGRCGGARSCRLPPARSRIRRSEARGSRTARVRVRDASAGGRARAARPRCPRGSARRPRSGRIRRRGGRPSGAAARPGRGARCGRRSPVEAVELRSKTSAIRPIGCGPSLRSRKSSRIWPRVRSRAGDGGTSPRHALEDLEHGLRRRRSARVSGRLVQAHVDSTRPREVSSSAPGADPARQERGSAGVPGAPAGDRGHRPLALDLRHEPVVAVDQQHDVARPARRSAPRPRRRPATAGGSGRAGRPRRSAGPARPRRRSAARPPARRRAGPGRGRRRRRTRRSRPAARARPAGARGPSRCRTRAPAGDLPDDRQRPTRRHPPRSRRDRPATYSGTPSRLGERSATMRVAPNVTNQARYRPTGSASQTSARGRVSSEMERRPDEERECRRPMSPARSSAGPRRRPAGAARRRPRPSPPPSPRPSRTGTPTGCRRRPNRGRA